MTEIIRFIRGRIRKRERKSPIFWNLERKTAERKRSNAKTNGLLCTAGRLSFGKKLW